MNATIPVRSRLAIVLVLAAAGCVQTDIIRIDQLKTAPPRERPAQQWKAAVDDALELYEASPGLTAGDARLEPMFGGISTLVYYGGDLDQKLADQRIAGSALPNGTDAASVCQAAAPAAGSPPSFTPLWIPVAQLGGAPHPSLRCDDAGRPHGEQALCMFGQAALQPAARSDLILVVPGLFDSSAQHYVRDIGTALYEAGFSVLLLDMRDHGNTMRAAPSLPLSLGAAEGADVLHAAAAMRAACGDKLGRVGAVGVSGGGLDVIRAYAADGNGKSELDLGVLAISPLLDVELAVADMGEERSCKVGHAIELQPEDTALLGGFGGVTFTGAALLGQAFAGEGIDGEAVAWSALAGVGFGVLTGIAIDAWLDGSSADQCIPVAATGRMFRDLLQTRWTTLLAFADAAHLSAAERSITSSSITLDAYLARAKTRYAGLGMPWVPPSPGMLAALLRKRQEPARVSSRLLVIGADDDPVTRLPALSALASQVAGLSDVHVTHVRHGGHGAMWSVQEPMMRALVARFFR